MIRQYTQEIMSGKGKGGKGGRGAGKKTVSKSAKAGLQFPVARIGRFLKKVSLADAFLVFVVNLKP